MKKGNIIGVILALLVLLFVYTAFSKLFDLDTFRGNMYNQHIPGWLAGFLTWSIPPAEIFVVVCLLFARTQRLGLYCSLILLSVYTIYIAALLLHFFRKIPCSCGGIFRHMSWEQHFWFNLAFIALTMLALVLRNHDRPSHRHRFLHQ